MRIAVLDIGGTSIKSGIWNGKQILEERETPTNAKEGGSRLMERVEALLQEYVPFEAVGISTAGQVDACRGSIYYANENIPGYTGMEVRRILEEKFQVPTAVENDVNSAAIGEGAFGAGKGFSDFLCLTYGTGVGGAIMMGGEIYRGSSWSAGSFGGILVHPEEVRPGEETSGCYERYASATALIRRAQKEDPSLTDGRRIFEAMERPQVRRVIDEWIDEIVNGLVTLVHVFNPSCVILGGGVMAQPYVSEQVRERLFSRVFGGFEGVNLVRASLGNRAGMIGAACLAERLLEERRGS